jgi:hypothetical protein
MINGNYEDDRVQCTEMTDKGKRCSYVGVASVGNQIRCERHHQKYLVKKANDVPIVRKPK